MPLHSRQYHAGELAILAHLVDRPSPAGAIVKEVLVPGWPPEHTATLLTNCLHRLVLQGDVLLREDGCYELCPALSLELRAMRRRPLNTLLPLAEALRDELRGAAARVEIAGSLRRRTPDCGDIEICALADDQSARDLLAARSALVIKSGERYTQVVMDDQAVGPVKVDFFQTRYRQEWGMLFFIRTGSADFVRRALAYWKRLSAGGECRGNLLWRGDGVQVQTFEEEDVFRALGCRWVEPKDRTPRPQEPT
jgi:DNA polymerase/3'-5' exonuclease PolX